MTKILEEVRELASNAIALKQDSAKQKYPELIRQIKGAAQLGKTQCEFPEHQIDQYSKKLLEADEFRVYATTKMSDSKKWGYDTYNDKPVSIWIVSWQEQNRR